MISRTSSALLALLISGAVLADQTVINNFEDGQTETTKKFTRGSSLRGFSYSD